MAYVPTDVDAFALVVDAQGFDTAVVLSAGKKQLRRFRYVVIECQELWPEHPRRYNPKSPTCTQAMATLRTERQLHFVACMRNAALSEYNCLFTRGDDPIMSDPTAAARAIDDVQELWVYRKAFDGIEFPSDAVDSRLAQSYAAQALNFFVPNASEAFDLAVLMCPMWTPSTQLAPDCAPRLDRTQLLDQRRMCQDWLHFCKSAKANDRRKYCVSPFSLRCPKTAISWRRHFLPPSVRAMSDRDQVQYLIRAR